MTTLTHASNLQDDRWGGYVPWFLRQTKLPVVGNFELFFARLSQRLKRFFEYNEAALTNPHHFGAYLETESFQRFRFDPKIVLFDQISQFFSPNRIGAEAFTLSRQDPEAKRVEVLKMELQAKIRSVLDIHEQRKQQKLQSRPLDEAELINRQTHVQRMANHFRMLAHQRLGVLEALLRIVPADSTWLPHLSEDIRRAFAESQIMLDLKGTPSLIVPLDEPLLQTEVIGRLLPRLANRFPQQEKDLVKAYHDLVQGGDSDTIFVLAVKALEEIARGVSRRPKLTLEAEKDLKAAFPDLHPTIYITITKLANHRGDKAGHGRHGPPPHEMRYLLFTVCNVALLFLDYPSPSQRSQAS